MYNKSITDLLKNTETSYQRMQKQLGNACKIPKITISFPLEELITQSKKLEDVLRPPKIIQNSPLVEFSNVYKQVSVFDKILKPIPGVSAKSFLSTLPSFDFPNIIIPRPVDNSIFPLGPEKRRTPSPETDSTTVTDEVPDKKRIFIGHGHSNCWKELRDFVTTDLRLFYDEFNRSPAAGLPISKRLEQMLEEAEMAFLIMTAQNEYADGTLHASNNVIHEIGLFQGRLGFKKAIILLEEGCEEFSNIHGLVQIRFPKGNIEAAFEEIRQVLEREGVI